jgi:hypothetical protein
MFPTIGKTRYRHPYNIIDDIKGSNLSESLGGEISSINSHKCCAVLIKFVMEEFIINEKEELIIPKMLYIMLGFIDFMAEANEIIITEISPTKNKFKKMSGMGSKYFSNPSIKTLFSSKRNNV